jgi:signal transduction histidine kinase
MMENREPFTVDDTSKQKDLVQGAKAVFESLSPCDARAGTSWLGVPVVTKNQVIGVISLLHNQPGHYTHTMAEVVQDLANRAAIAIENARLHQQVQQTAVLEERARLAGELHDSVTQTLFTSSLLAEAMPRIWDKDQTTARQNLDQLTRLLRGALADMRTLLHELRPAAVQDQTMGPLLEPLAESARARTYAEINLQIEGDRPLPGNVTTALHRIAQECLNNVAKHAEATHVYVELVCGPEEVVLRITDDGRGFDPAHISPGHYGIGIMRDRAQQIGAIFEIESHRGDGTQVVVTWSDQGEGDA